jgi:nickel-dependent lactate racemase
MKITLAYGKSGLEVELNDDWDIIVVEPKFIESLIDVIGSIRKSLNNPYGLAPLKEIVTAKEKVGIVFSDITRPMPRQLILDSIFSELNFIPKENFILFNSLGTHRENSEAELIEMLGKNIYNNYKIVQNNAFDKSTQINLGRSSKGHEIWLNKDLFECDLVILTGFIEPHFFAGFSGGGKAIMPGMAGLETVLGNHDAKMISDSNATWGITNGNPVWEEVNEVADKIKNKFLLNVSLNNRKEVTKVFAGDLKKAHEAGCNFVKESAMVPVDNLFDIVITTNSGYPLDLNLYQTVKGMSAAAQIVKENGTIIIASECWDGIPEHGLFGQLQAESNSPSELLDRILHSSETRPDQWQAQIQVQIQQKADIYVYTDYLSEEQVNKCLLKHCKDISGTVEKLQNESKDRLKICVLPEGPQTVPYLK